MKLQEPAVHGGNKKRRRPQAIQITTALVILIAAGALAALASIAAPAARADGYLLICDYGTNSVLRYNETTGAFVDAFVPHQSGGLREPMGVIFGLDHNLYVSGGLHPNNGTGHKAVLRYNGVTGAFIDDFADSNQLESPRAIVFGPDGNLYVASGSSGTADRVVRYNGTTGAFIDYFVSPGSGGFRNPTGMVFGPDGKNDGKLDLYVGNAFAHTIMRYDGTTGAFKGVFVSSGSGGLTFPFGMAFGPDGNLYVASANYNFSLTSTFPPGAVLRYEGPSGPNPGAFLGVFIAGGSGGLGNPGGLLFGPGGDLYVTSTVAFQKQDNGKFHFEGVPGTNQVLRYNGTTGAFKGVFVTPDSGGLSFPTLMTFTETDPTTLNYHP